MSAAALLAAIRSAPEDDAPRLVYADWLDEHGQPERAEFIRVQCELARTDSPALRRREAELLAAHHNKLAGPFAAPGVRYLFARGFIVRFGHTGLFVSTRRGGRSEAWTYIRFMPNGTIALFISSSGPKPIADGIREMARRSLSPYFTTYSLDAIDHPGTVRIFPTEEDAVVDLWGAFEGKALFLDKFDPRDNRRSRKHYTHVHIDGFDSSTES